jgi:hypothetical protein
MLEYGVPGYILEYSGEPGALATAMMVSHYS